VRTEAPRLMAQIEAAPRDPELLQRILEEDPLVHMARSGVPLADLTLRQCIRLASERQRLAEQPIVVQAYAAELIGGLPE
jgi:hypothetical protein